MWGRIFNLAFPALLPAVFAAAAGATPAVNGARIETRTFNDCRFRSALIEITDAMDAGCVGFANLHISGLVGCECIEGSDHTLARKPGAAPPGAEGPGSFCPTWREARLVRIGVKLPPGMAVETIRLVSSWLERGAADGCRGAG